MPKFVILGNWTEQGIKNVRETTKRAQAAKEAAAKRGGKIDIWWTMGRYDIVGVLDMPTSEAALSFLVALGMQGNIETETLPAWDASTVDEVLKTV
ncbi:MAG TPA: GYD domain-containing protein [Candidatus Limnocylindrales bacterium]|nr:GYD domain-containing protein [Candidatus Limnocylindrales bacterium]